MTNPLISNPTTVPVNEEMLDACERLAGVTSHRTLDGNEEGTEYTIATSRTQPWHRFGPTFVNDMTIDEALVASHTDTIVVAQDLTTIWVGDDGEITELVAPDRSARITTNPFTGKPQYLGSTGKNLPIIQNREALEWAYDILGAVRGDGETGLITSIGTFHQQRKFFASLVLPTHIMVGGVDRVDLYLSVIEAHDGTAALKAVTSPVRTECRNTTTMALDQAVSRVSLNHTKGIKDRMRQVRHLLDITENYEAEFQAMADKLWEKDFTNLQFEAMVEKIYNSPRPDPEKVSKTSVTQWNNRLNGLLAQRTDPANAGSQVGSGWNALQAVVSYDNFAQRVKGKTAEEKSANRAAGILLGENDRIEQKAMAYILAAR